jgi:Flp pilus assembly CpaF family ATPase
MLPNRILVGELSGPEVFEVLRLMDKGYDGTIAAVFANSPQEALDSLPDTFRLKTVIALD